MKDRSSSIGSVALKRIPATEKGYSTTSEPHRTLPMKPFKKDSFCFFFSAMVVVTFEYCFSSISTRVFRRAVSSSERAEASRADFSCRNSVFILFRSISSLAFFLPPRFRASCRLVPL